LAHPVVIIIISSIYPVSLNKLILEKLLRACSEVIFHEYIPPVLFCRRAALKKTMPFCFLSGRALLYVLVAFVRVQWQKFQQTVVLFIENARTSELYFAMQVLVKLLYQTKTWYLSLGCYTVVMNNIWHIF